MTGTATINDELAVPKEPIVLPWPCDHSEKKFVEWSAVMYEVGANFAAMLNDDPVVASVTSGLHAGTVSLTGKPTVVATRKHVKRRITRRLLRCYGQFRNEMHALSDRAVDRIENDFWRKVMR